MHNELVNFQGLDTLNKLLTIFQAEIKDNVFRLCGIALSNRTAPALITACMGVSMCKFL